MRIRETFLAAAIALAPVGASAAVQGDWPCIQRRVGELTSGQMWGGPPIEGQAQGWREDAAAAALARQLAARKTPIEEAEKAVAAFAEAAGKDKDSRLTLVFAGVLDLINAERSRLIGGIERYARKQRDLADRIRQTSIALQAAGAAASNDAQQNLLWETRIYDERNHALTYVCESPVILEQRAFALARIIQAHLE